MTASDMIHISEKQEHRTTTPPPIKAAARGEGGTAGVGGKVRVGNKSGSWVGSTKLRRLELELREMKRKRAGAKAVVFSQVCLILRVWDIVDRF